VTYPIIMMIVGALVMGILMVFVIPQITEVFEDSEKALPWNTQLLIGMSDLLASFWFLLIPIGFGAWWALRRWSRTTHGRVRLDRLKLKLWIVGHHPLRASGCSPELFLGHPSCHARCGQARAEGVLAGLLHRDRRDGESIDRMYPAHPLLPFELPVEYMACIILFVQCEGARPS
jgi:hypothetical protein